MLHSIQMLYSSPCTAIPTLNILSLFFRVTTPKDSGAGKPFPATGFIHLVASASSPAVRWRLDWNQLQPLQLLKYQSYQLTFTVSTAPPKQTMI